MLTKSVRQTLVLRMWSLGDGAVVGGKFDEASMAVLITCGILVLEAGKGIGMAIPIRVPHRTVKHFPGAHAHLEHGGNRLNSRAE